MPGLPRASPATDRHRSRFRAALALLPALWIAWPFGQARADARDAVRVVVLARDIEAPIVRRLRAELTAQGFETIPYWAPAVTPSANELAAIEGATDARAVLRLDDAARVVEVWLSVAEGASPLLVDTVRWAVTGPDDESVAAVQAAETLHAALVRIVTGGSTPGAGGTPPGPAGPAGGTPPGPPGGSVAAGAPNVLGPVAPTDSSSAPVASPPVSWGPTGAPVAQVLDAAPPALRSPVADRSLRPAFAFAAGMAVVAAPGGLGPMADVSLAAWWRLFPHWSIGLFGGIPVLSGSVSQTQGVAHAEPALVGGEVVRGLDRPTWIVHPEVALGGGATWLHDAGTGTSRYIGVSSDIWMAMVLARAGLALSLGRDWRVRADASAGIALPEASVSFAGSRVATWGRPIFVGGASLEVDLGGNRDER